MNTGAYRFADLENDEDLLSDINLLETKLQQKLGKDITLIAYSKGEPTDRQQS